VNAAAYGVLFICIAMAIICSARYFYLARTRQSKLALTADKEYRGLADEYRRLSDMAITTNEHIDLRLTDLSVRVDELRDQLDQMQRILKEVE
jgi:Tfp pilus assembly protein PilO